MNIYPASHFNKVAVLYGGLSGERDISLISGRGVLESLQRQGVNAHGIDVGEQIIDQLQQSNCDLVFNVLHGNQGEDGKVQALLELMRLPYAGSGVLACALAMDKWRSKLFWKAAGLPVLPAVFLKPGDDGSDAGDIIDLPYCVKPCHSGSSLGVTKVERRDDLPKAIEDARQYSEDVMIEPFIRGREFTVGIVQDEVLPVLEICAPGGFYDYEAKYHSPETTFHCPADLSEKETQLIKAVAWDAFIAIGGKGWGRIDFMQDDDGRFWILEMNPVPGMTPRSDVPMAAKAIGWSYDELVLRILSSI